MSSKNSYEDLLSFVLKYVTEKETTSKFEFTTEQIIDLIVHLLFVYIETRPKTFAMVVQRLSKNTHTIKELRVSTSVLKEYVIGTTLVVS